MRLVPLALTRHPIRFVALCGTASLIIYVLAFVLPFNLFEAVSNRLPPDIAEMTEYRRSAGLIYVLAMLALFGSYVLAWYVTRSEAGQAHGTIMRRVIWGFAIIFCLCLLFLYPLTAQDVFLYMTRGRILVVHGANPMRWPIEAFPMDDYLPFQTEWLDQRSPYGPLWEYMAGTATFVGDRGLAPALISYKGLAILGYVGCGLLIGAILRHRAPRWELPGLLFFTWNPLVLVETAGGGHNDAVMMFFVLLSLWLWEKRRAAWVIPALVAGALVKYLPLMLVPLVLVGIWRDHSGKRRWAILVRGALISAVLIAAIWGPLWPGLENWDMLGQVKQANNSPATLLILLLARHMPSWPAFDAGRYLLLGAFAVCYAIVLVQLIRRKFDLQRAMYYAFFWYLLSASFTFGHWYVTWLVALAAIIVDRIVHSRTVVFAWAAESSPFIYTWQRHWMAERWDTIDVYSVAIPFVFALPLLVPLLTRSQSEASPRIEGTSAK